MASKWDNAKQAGGGGGDYPDTWKPEKGDSIEGVYESKAINQGPNNSNMYYLKTSDGTVGVWGSTVLDNQFESTDDSPAIPIGSEVQITYLGKEVSKRGNDFKNYKVLYLPPEGKIEPTDKPAKAEEGIDF